MSYLSLTLKDRDGEVEIEDLTEDGLQEARFQIERQSAEMIDLIDEKMSELRADEQAA